MQCNDRKTSRTRNCRIKPRKLQAAAWYHNWHSGSSGHRCFWLTIGAPWQRTPGWRPGRTRPWPGQAARCRTGCTLRWNQPPTTSGKYEFLETWLWQQSRHTLRHVLFNCVRLGTMTMKTERNHIVLSSTNKHPSQANVCASILIWRV